MKNYKKTKMEIIKKTLTLSLGILAALFAVSCSDDDIVLTPTNMVDVGEYKLFTKSIGEGNHTLVFESGLGDNYEAWYKLSSLSEENQVIAYSRAGYDPSESATNERGIAQLAEDLHEVILSKSKNEKVILIGHSLGGAIIRYYAVQHPKKVEGLLFVDPSHEANGIMTQEQEDDMVEHFIGQGQPEIANEGRQMIENFELLGELSALPDVPTVVLTGLKDLTGEDRTNWLNAHTTLGEGLTDFTHVTAENSGHYIQIEQPQLVLEAIDNLLDKSFIK